MSADDTTPLPLPERKSNEADELPPGSFAGDWRIEQRIAQGGCGVVYEARHRLLDQKAAIKVLHRDLTESMELVERFFREAQAASLIRHPNIVEVFHVGVLPDARPYMAMELLEGQGLDKLIRRAGPLPPAQVLEILEPLGDALAAAHLRGIVHRDLKASNVFVGRPGLPWRVKLLDFGIAKMVGPGVAGITRLGTRLGTPIAMPPEQIRGEAVDLRADIYALGVLIYHMLVAEPPFRAEDPAEIERMHIEAPPPRPSQRVPVSAAMDEVVLRCLEKQPERRYGSVPALMEALRHAVPASRAILAASQEVPEVPMIGVAVDIRASGEEMDDALLDDVERCLDLTDSVLCRAGLPVLLQTGSYLLRARKADDCPAELARAVEAARALDRTLATRPGGDPRTHITLCVHVETAVLSGGSEIRGGRLLQIAAWAPQEPGVFVTDAVAEALPGLTGIAHGRHLELAKRV